MVSALLALGGWFFGGFVVLGQPHIVIRLVSMDPAASLWRMRGIYYFWFTLFYGATIAVGLLARLVVPPSEGFDPETALPVIAMELLPEWGAGCILAALFAATLSTADSLVLACSAAVTRDVAPNVRHSLRLAKGATATVVLVAMAIALGGDRSVFSLVLDAWGLLGVAFVPLLILSVRGVSLSAARGFVTIIVGVASFLLWNHLGYGSIIYGASIGVGAGIMVGLPWSKLVLHRS